MTNGAPLAASGAGPSRTLSPGMADQELEHCVAVVEAELRSIFSPESVTRGAKVLKRERALARGQMFEAVLDEVERISRTSPPEAQIAFRRLLERIAMPTFGVK